MLYRSMMESEIEASRSTTKSEGELAQDDINTIGEIFANYQTAMHMFESTIGTDGASESVPRSAVQDFIAGFTEKFFREIMDVDLDAIPFLYEDIQEAIGSADEPSEDVKQEKERGAADELAAQPRPRRARAPGRRAPPACSRASAE